MSKLHVKERQIHGKKLKIYPVFVFWGKTAMVQLQNTHLRRADDNVFLHNFSHKLNSYRFRIKNQFQHTHMHIYYITT